MRRAYKTPSHLPLGLHHNTSSHYTKNKNITKYLFFFCFVLNSLKSQVLCCSAVSPFPLSSYEVGFRWTNKRKLLIFFFFIKKNGFLRLASYSLHRNYLPLLPPVLSLSAPPWILETPTPAGNNGLALRRRDFPAILSRP